MTPVAEANGTDRILLSIVSLGFQVTCRGNRQGSSPDCSFALVQSSPPREIASPHFQLSQGLVCFIANDLLAAMTPLSLSFMPL